MKHTLLFLIFGFLLCGCSSTPTNPDSTPVRFSAPAVELTLQQALHYEQYPDQAGLAELVRSQLEAALKDEGLLANKDDPGALSIAIRMNYQRIFAGEATPFPSSSVGPPRLSYTVEVSQDKSTKAMIERHDITVNRGFASNLKTLFLFYLGNTPEAEEKDVAILAKSMVKEISTLKARY